MVSLNDNNIWYYFIVTTGLYSLENHNHSLKLQNENLQGFFFGTLYRWMEKVTCQIPEEGMVPAQPGAKRTKISPILFSTNLAVMLTHYMTWILSWPSFIFFFHTENGCHAQSLHKIHIYFVLKMFSGLWCLWNIK